MKKALPWILLAAVILVVVFRKQIANWFNTGTTVPPAEGSECTANGKKGTIKNGQCVVVDTPLPPAERIIITSPSWFWMGRRRAICYSKPVGTSCPYRKFEPSLGLWGTLYSQTATSCCYLF